MSPVGGSASHLESGRDDFQLDPKDLSPISGDSERYRPPRSAPPLLLADECDRARECGREKEPGGELTLVGENAP